MVVLLPFAPNLSGTGILDFYYYTGRSSTSTRTESEWDGYTTIIPVVLVHAPNPSGTVHRRSTRSSGYAAAVMRSISLVDHLRFPCTGTAFPNSICLGDVDGDGDAELLVATSEGLLNVYKGTSIPEGHARTPPVWSSITMLSLGNPMTSPHPQVGAQRRGERRQISTRLVLSETHRVLRQNLLTRRIFHRQPA